MTIFPKGRVLSYAEIHAKYEKEIKNRAVIQFSRNWPHIADIDTPEKLWGDEMEWSLVRFQHAGDDKAARIYAPLDREVDRDRAEEEGKHIALWKSEGACYQIETSPVQPYGESFDEFVRLEQCLTAQQNFFRQQYLTSQQKTDDDLLFLAQIPVNGMPGFTDPNSDCPSNPLEYPYPSMFFNIKKALTTTHEIYRRLTANQLERSGGMRYHQVPIFVDTNTPQPFVEDLVKRHGILAGATTKYVQPQVKENFIVVEHGGQGCTNCAMQVTQQFRNRTEACYAYDQLATLAPLFTALTAAAPFCRGYLTAWDSRWALFCRSWDNRTPAQRKPKSENSDTLPYGEQPVGFTRFHSIEMYASEDAQRFNDIPKTLDLHVFKSIHGENRVPDLFAQYISQYFVMEPVVLSEDDLENETYDTMGLFYNMQDFTNWTTVRLKFPIMEKSAEGTVGDTLKVKAGWRVEFRPMGVQMNAFQCSAFLSFVVLVTRALLKYGIDFRMLLSLVEKNIEEAVKIDAYRSAKFWWRKMPTIDDKNNTNVSMVQLTAEEIICGKANEFFGLIPLVERYISEESKELSQQTRTHICKYLAFVRARAQGQEKTVADWMRTFVRNHPAYKHDSVVPMATIYDMMVEYRKFQQ